MIFSGLEYTCKAPFNTVLFHGIVRDSQGRKMSKSLGNGVDPLEEIEKYGADALRFTLATGNTPGNDMRYSPEKVEASRNFANKIWNAARFMQMNFDGTEKAPYIPENLRIEDKWVLSLYNKVVAEVTDNLEKFELGLAVAKLYDFIWDVFCDWYIEICKIRLNGEDKAEKETAKAVLIYVFSNTMKLLHPFMPFVTEELWQSIPHEGETIMLSEWPKFKEELVFAKEENDFEIIMQAVRAIRNRRNEMNVPPSKKAALFVETKYEDLFNSSKQIFNRLASASEITVGEGFSSEGAVCVVTNGAKMFIPLNELIDFEAERARLNKELEKANVDKEFFEKKLNNPGFVNKAPAQVVEAQKEQLAKVLEKIAILEKSIEELK